MCQFTRIPITRLTASSRITSPPNLSYFLFIFYFPRCTLPDFPSVSSLTSFPYLPCHHNNKNNNKQCRCSCCEFCVKMSVKLIIIRRVATSGGERSILTRKNVAIFLKIHISLSEAYTYFIASHCNPCELTLVSTGF